MLGDKPLICNIVRYLSACLDLAYSPTYTVLYFREVLWRFLRISFLYYRIPLRLGSQLLVKNHNFIYLKNSWIILKLVSNVANLKSRIKMQFTKNSHNLTSLFIQRRCNQKVIFPYGVLLPIGFFSPFRLFLRTLI